MPFRYVEDPEQCAPAVEGEVPCGVCGLTGRFAYGSGFAGRDVEAVCVACIEKGLPEWISMRRDGDRASLRRQLAELHPSWSKEQVQADVRAKDAVLAHHTPPILSWQDWFWPACCGDYCQFLRDAGQDQLSDLAREQRVADGRTLLTSAVLDGIPDLWDVLPKSVDGPKSNESPQAYVFRCTTCKRIRITWDSH